MFPCFHVFSVFYFSLSSLFCFCFCLPTALSATVSVYFVCCTVYDTYVPYTYQKQSTEWNACLWSGSRFVCFPALQARPVVEIVCSFFSRFVSAPYDTGRGTGCNGVFSWIYTLENTGTSLSMTKGIFSAGTRVQLGYVPY